MHNYLLYESGQYVWPYMKKNTEHEIVIDLVSQELQTIKEVHHVPCAQVHM